VLSVPCFHRHIARPKSQLNEVIKAPSYDGKHITDGKTISRWPPIDWKPHEQVGLVGPIKGPLFMGMTMMDFT